MSHQSGIYEILNTVNGKRYIGSAVNFKNRWRAHRRELNLSTHHSLKLQRAWSKYGEQAFKFLPVLICAPTRSMLLFYEQQMLDTVRPEYNIAVSADSPTRGGKLSEEHKTRIGAAHRGKIVSEESRAKMALARVGKTLSVEARDKIKEFHRGRVHSPEHLANQRAAIAQYHKDRVRKSDADQKEKKAAAQRLRRAKKRGVELGAPYIVSQETRDKRSASLKGRVFSDETCAKISAALKGRQVSEETRKKMGDASRGRKMPPRTPEHCAAISRQRKEYWATRKAQNGV